MGLDGSEELRLVQSADSLSQAHGFLSFDYRIYGVTASYTPDNAQSLLPKILEEMNSTFNVGASTPLVLMISWFQHQTNRADMLLYIQWDGFARLSEFDSGRRGLIETLTKDAYSSSPGIHQHTPQKALAAAISKFRILLNPVLTGYFLVDDTLYTENDTLFTCQCAKPIRLAAYRGANLPFTKNGKQKWNNAAKYLFDNIGELDRMKASPNSGTVVQADFTDSVGVQYTAKLRVYVVDVDFEDAKGSFSFDDNTVQQYSSFKRDANGDIIRGKNIPKSFTDKVIVKIDPGSVAHKVYFSASGSTVNPIKANANSTKQTVDISHMGNTYMDNLVTHVGSLTGCDYGKLALLHPDTITIKLKVIWVTEEDDDVQIIPLNNGRMMSIGILSGSDNILQSTPSRDDARTPDGRSIHTGNNGLLESSVDPNDIQSSQISGNNRGEMNQRAISYGANKFLDTNISGLGGDDRAMRGISLDTAIHSGVNGICETQADGLSNILNSGQINSPLIAGVDQIFRKVGVYVTLKSVESASINYDLDHDGLLLRPANKEAAQLLNSYNFKQKIYNNKILPGFNTVGLFFVHGLVQNYAVGVVDGVAISGSKSFVLPFNYSGGARTIAHEIGHAAFSFLDTISIIPQGADPDNLMSYYTTGTMLRMFQWEEIHLAIAGITRN
jgi:hypothetical protein